MRIQGKIPITIHPLFWLTAAAIGFFNTGSLIGILMWIVVVTISILIHELGHASTALFFGLQPRIELVALGGLTFHQGDRLPFWKQFLIVLNGPLFGFMLFVVAWLLLKVAVPNPSGWHTFVSLFFFVNLFWTLLNLIPVMPLDGGQLLRIGLEALFGPKGLRYSLLIGMCIGGGISLLAFLVGQFLIGALFFLFAFQSGDMFRRLRQLGQGDDKPDLKAEFEKAELQLQSGNKDLALFAFDRIRLEAKEGMIHLMATQYVAFLKYELGKNEEVYALLLPMRPQLSTEALCLLHQVAFDLRKFSVVEEIGANCFQTTPDKEVALRNAYACALQGKAQPSVGWLETAFQEGLENLDLIIQEKAFDSIRDTEYFKQFMKHHCRSQS